MKTLLAVLMLLPIFGFASTTLDTLPSVAKVSAHTAYVPAGFDSNDRVTFMVEGAFTDSCQRVGPYKKVIEPGKITVYLFAYKYNGGCQDVMVPFSDVVELGIVPEGRYAVVDGHSGKVLGQLPVRGATKTDPDDHFYAPVSDVNIAYGPAYNAISVSGTFHSSCLTVKEVKAVVDGARVVTVLPIAEKTSGNCVNGRFPYRKYTPFPAGVNGRNLLHVRSLSGQALNKLVDL